MGNYLQPTEFTIHLLRSHTPDNVPDSVMQFKNDLALLSKNANEIAQSIEDIGCSSNAAADLVANCLHPIDLAEQSYLIVERYSLALESVIAYISELAKNAKPQSKLIDTKRRYTTTTQFVLHLFRVDYPDIIPNTVYKFQQDIENISNDFFGAMDRIDYISEQMTNSDFDLFDQCYYASRIAKHAYIGTNEYLVALETAIAYHNELLKGHEE